MTSQFLFNFFVRVDRGEGELPFGFYLKEFRCDFMEKLQIVQSGGAFKVVVNDSIHE